MNCNSNPVQRYYVRLWDCSYRISIPSRALSGTGSFHTPLRKQKKSIQYRPRKIVLIIWFWNEMGWKGFLHDLGHDLSHMFFGGEHTGETHGGGPSFRMRLLLPPRPSALRRQVCVRPASSAASVPIGESASSLASVPIGESASSPASMPIGESAFPWKGSRLWFQACPPRAVLLLLHITRHVRGTRLPARSHVLQAWLLPLRTVLKVFLSANISANIRNRVKPNSLFYFILIF